MTKAHHVNCGTLKAAENFTILCHCPGRMASLAQLKRLNQDHSNEIDMFGYHDPTEFKAA